MHKILVPTSQRTKSCNKKTSQLHAKLVIRSLMLTAFGSLACSYCWTSNAQDGAFVLAVASVGMQLGWITEPQESLFRISPVFCGIFTSRSIPLLQTPRPSACQMLHGSVHGNPKMSLTYRGPCIMIYSCNKPNEIH